MTFRQKVPKSFFQGRFWKSKIDIYIFSFKNINLGDHFLLKHYFLASIFEPLYFLKSCPIFDEPSFINGYFLNFPLCMLLLGPKFSFSDPPYSKFHHRNDIKSPTICLQDIGPSKVFSTKSQCIIDENILEMTAFLATCQKRPFFPLTTFSVTY